VQVARDQGAIVALEERLAKLAHKYAELRAQARKDKHALAALQKDGLGHGWRGAGGDDDDNQTASTFATLPAARVEGHLVAAADAQETRRLQAEVASLTQQLAAAGSYVTQLSDRLQFMDAVAAAGAAAAAGGAGGGAGAASSSALTVQSPARAMWPGTPADAADAAAAAASAYLEHEVARTEQALREKEAEVARGATEARALLGELTRAYEALQQAETAHTTLLRRLDDAVTAREGAETRAAAAEAAAAAADTQLSRLRVHLDELLVGKAGVEARNAELESHAAGEAAAHGALVAQVGFASQGCPSWQGS